MQNSWCDISKLWGKPACATEELTADGAVSLLRTLGVTSVDFWGKTRACD